MLGVRRDKHRGKAVNEEKLEEFGPKKNKIEWRNCDSLFNPVQWMHHGWYMEQRIVDTETDKRGL